MSQCEQWDIVTGVGLTALGVAAGRAMETHRPGGLVHDPYAEAFVAAADPPVPMPTHLPGSDGGATGGAAHQDGGGDSDVDELWTQMADHIGIRSRFFDDYLAQAARSGIDQMVVLAAGLDTRAFRLHWPAGATVFELDQPPVLEFKQRVLAEQAARAGCSWRPVGVDLRTDWAPALQQAGHDPAGRTAWLAEGLLPYLPQPSREALLATITSLSSPGSRLATEHIQDLPALLDDPVLARTSRRFGVDLPALMPDPGEEDQAPETWLAAHQWAVRVDPADRVGRIYGRPLHSFTPHVPAHHYRFVTAWA